MTVLFALSELPSTLFVVFLRPRTILVIIVFFILHYNYSSYFMIIVFDIYTGPLSLSFLFGTSFSRPLHPVKLWVLQ